MYLTHLAPLLLTLLLGVAACTNLSTLEQPTVQVSAIHLLPGPTLIPGLAIDLQVSNPNSVPLPLKAFTYELTLNNHRVISGVADELATLPAHGTAEVTLSATPDMTGATGLLQQLMLQPRAQLTYQLQGELDMGLLLPTLRLERSGKLPVSH